jgi:hypothetical protein
VVIRSNKIVFTSREFHTIPESQQARSQVLNNYFLGLVAYRVGPRAEPWVNTSDN